LRRPTLTFVSEDSNKAKEERENTSCFMIKKEFLNYSFFQSFAESVNEDD